MGRLRDAPQWVERTIAGDEARHAELGWSILQWALDIGGDDVRDAVRALRDVETATPSTAGVEQFGRLGPTHVREMAERHAALSRTRLDALL